MGIYVQCVASAPCCSPEECAALLTDAAEEWAVANGLAKLFFAGDFSGSTVFICIYPPAGGISFELTPDRIAFGVKTSIGGPGYHAALIQLCDHIEQKLGIRWRWEAGGDTSNYATSRDFAALQTEFLDQFLGYCGVISEGEEGERQLINLDQSFGADNFEGVGGPLGPVPNEVFKNALWSNDAQLGARHIFPWLGRKIDQEFWSKTLRSMLWTEVEWRKPRTRWERHVHQAVLEIQNFESDLSAAIKELEEISSRTEEFGRPSNRGVGYKRNARAFNFPGPWQIWLPGYYLDDVEENGRTICVWFGGEEVRGSSLTVDLSTKSGNFWSKDFDTLNDHPGRNCIYRLQQTSRLMQDGVTEIAFAQFQAFAEGKGHFLSMSVCTSSSNAANRLAELAREVVFRTPPMRPPSDLGH